jgi:hypothetical protein
MGFSCSTISSNAALTNITLPSLARAGLLSVSQNARLSSLSIRSISVAGSIDIDVNPLLSDIDFSALQTVSGYFNVNLPALDILKADSLRNATGYIYVSRCLQPKFSTLVDALIPTLAFCDLGRGNLFAGKNAVVCVPCQPGFYKAVQSNEACTVCPGGETSTAESSSCSPLGSCALVSIPENGCVSSIVPINAVPGGGTWSCLNASVTFANNAMGSTTLTSTSAGSFSIVWTSGNCTIPKTITIVGPTVASIPMPTGSLCGPTGSVNIGADLSGDAIFGKWTVTPSVGGSFSNTVPAFTHFSWTQPGPFTLQFTPKSVCNTPAVLTVQIDPQCPQVLSRETTIGIGVGATLGGLILVAAGILAAVKIYQAWNRHVVQFRDKDVTLAQSDYYKF